MTPRINNSFGPDKSQILRGLAIIFMIMLHNGVSDLFKICVPIFTFLVGYGYAFAKAKNLRHAVKRSWHLLSHFWLILFGIFVPVAILQGGWNPNLPELFYNMFGLESELNWYSWYIYFYIYAMVIMIPISRIIVKYKIWACLALILICFGAIGAIHLIPEWSNNTWLQAIHDCLLCSPVMFTGFYLAEGGGYYTYNYQPKLQICGICRRHYDYDICNQSTSICRIFRLHNRAIILYGHSCPIQYNRITEI